MLSFFTTPSATNTLADVGAWSSPFFAEMLPLAYIVAGFIVGGLLVSAVIWGIIRAIGHVVRPRSKFDD